MGLILELLALQGGSAPQTGTFVEGVGALLRARTVVDYEHGGQEVGTFTVNTRPTYQQVLELMDQAAQDLDTEIGADTTTFPRPDSIKPLALSLLKLRTAMLIELSFFPDSVASQHSPYEQIERMYDKRLPALIKAVAQAGAGDRPGSPDDELKPVFSFPPAPSSVVEFPAPTWWGGW